MHRLQDDIAVLKRLLREVFTNQIQMERRITAVEPEADPLPSFDALVRSHTGWGPLSSTVKAKVEVTGEVSLGTGLLWSKVDHKSHMKHTAKAHCKQQHSHAAMLHVYITLTVIAHVMQSLAC